MKMHSNKLYNSKFGLIVVILSLTFVVISCNLFSEPELNNYDDAVRQETKS